MYVVTRKTEWLLDGLEANRFKQTVSIFVESGFIEKPLSTLSLSLSSSSTTVSEAPSTMVSALWVVKPSTISKPNVINQETTMPRVIIHFEHSQIARCFQFCPRLVKRLQVLHGHSQPQLPMGIIVNTVGASMLSSTWMLSGTKFDWEENTNLPSFVVTRMEANGLATHPKS